MKVIKILIIVIAVMVLLPLLGYAGWLIKSGQPLEVFVVNKSMTHFRGSENKALNNILDRKKIYTAASRTYDLRIDHYGLIWNKGDYRTKFPRLREIVSTAEKMDLIYYADAAGILVSDLRELKEGEADGPEYGGLNNSDYTLIREFMQLGKPIVAECSFFAPPTEPLVRFNLEKLTDVYYVGWIGKYVKDLSEYPDQQMGLDWKRLYGEYTGNTWTATGPGLVLINPEARRILVLKEGEHIRCSDGFIVTNKSGMQDYGLPGRVNYYGWFTLLHEGRNNVVSEFRLNPTEEGKVALNEFGIPETFPALIHADDHFYYLAGDFGKSCSGGLFSKVLVLGPLFDGLRSNSKSASRFYFSYYKPFMSRVIEDAQAIRDGEKQDGF